MSQKSLSIGHGCIKAEKKLGHKLSSCDECPFKDCQYGWSSEEARSLITILSLWHEGKSASEIIEETGVSERTIKRRLRAFRHSPYGSEWRFWRNTMIMDYYRRGESVGELAIIFGLEPRQVYRILKGESGEYSKQHLERADRGRAILLKMEQIYNKTIKWAEELEGF